MIKKLKKILDNNLLQENGKHIMLAAFPKSASTFLMHMLAKQLNYDIQIFLKALDGSEQEFEMTEFKKHAHKNTVTHQHIRATPYNIRMLKENNFTVFVLIRDLNECVMSLRRHIYTQKNNWSIANINDDFFKLCESKQYDFIIDLCMPWYINFYVYWYRAIEYNLIDAKFLSFNQITNDTKTTLNFILNNLGHKKLNNEEISQLYLSIKDKSRITKEMNIAFSQEILELNNLQKLKLKKLCSYYPSVDFKQIGV